MKLNFLIKKKMTRKYFLYKNKKRLPLEIVKFKLKKDYFNFLANAYEIPHNIGYCVSHTKGFNSLFMQYSLDIIFLNKYYAVIKYYKDLMPNKITNNVNEAYYCIIFSAGMINKYSISIYDLLEIKQEIVYK